MKTPVLIFNIIIIIISCSKPTKYDLVIENVGLFNGVEDKGVVNIGISDDTIAAITSNRLIGDSIINGTDKYVIPGLINSHVHLWSVEQLKESYESGILVNLAMHTGNEEEEAELKALGKDSTEISFLYGAGHAATVPRGHPNQISRNMETISDSVTIKTWVDNRIANGVDYIKIIKEDNPYLRYPARPTLSDEQIGEIIKYAKSKGFKTVIHASRADHFRNLFKYEPSGFVHTPHFNPDSLFTNEDWNMLKKSGAFLNPNIKQQELTFQRGGEFEQKWIAEHMVSMNDFMNFIKKANELGILLLAGSDSPVGNLNYGSDFIDEIQYFTRAGLSNLEALQTATGNPAKAFELEVGRLEVGSKVNMLLLKGNPIVDLEFLKQIEIIWKNGRNK